MSLETPSKKTQICPTCGTRLSDKAVRCLVCGTELNPEPEPKAVKKAERSVQAMDRIWERFGPEAIKRATLLENKNKN